MYSHGRPWTGRDSILVRLRPEELKASSALSSVPGRCSSENAMLSLLGFGGVAALPGVGVAHTGEVADQGPREGLAREQGGYAGAHRGQLLRGHCSIFGTQVG